MPAAMHMLARDALGYRSKVLCASRRKSMAAKPANTSYALQLVHGIQLELDYRAALEVVASLLSHCWASPSSPEHSRQPDPMCTR